MYRRLCLRRDRDARPLIDAMKRSPQAHGAFASLLGADFAVSPHAGNCRFAPRPPSPSPTAQAHLACTVTVGSPRPPIKPVSAAAHARRDPA